MSGVQRRRLDHIGNETAGRATTIVRYEPGSHFSPHVHTGGEEFIVLEGVFQDEHGDYPVGSYIRNPPQSSHTPGSDQGCIIFVKLWQFDLHDRTQVNIDLNKVKLIKDESRCGVKRSMLFDDNHEQVHVEHWEANANIDVNTSGGAEILVLEGDFNEGQETLRALSWIRIPIGENFKATAGAHGAKIWVKTGHLLYAERDIKQLPI